MSPIYSFKCKICKKEFDKMCKYEECKNVKCECGGDTEKLISNGIHVEFKGFGWYHTDYGKGRPPPPSSINRKTLARKRKELRKKGFQGDFHRKD